MAEDSTASWSWRQSKVCFWRPHPLLLSHFQPPTMDALKRAFGSFYSALAGQPKRVLSQKAEERSPKHKKVTQGTERLEVCVIGERGLQVGRRRSDNSSLIRALLELVCVLKPLLNVCARKFAHSWVNQDDQGPAASSAPATPRPPQGACATCHGTLLYLRERGLGVEIAKVVGDLTDPFVQQVRRASAGPHCRSPAPTGPARALLLPSIFCLALHSHALSQACPGGGAPKMPVARPLPDGAWLCGAEAIWQYVEEHAPDTPDLGRWVVGGGWCSAL